MKISNGLKQKLVDDMKETLFDQMMYHGKKQKQDLLTAKALMDEWVVSSEEEEEQEPILFIQDLRISFEEEV